MPTDTNSETAALELGIVLCGVSADPCLQLQFHFRFVPSLLLGYRGFLCQFIVLSSPLQCLS